MGQLWKPNQALSIESLLKLLHEAEHTISALRSPRGGYRWIFFTAYAVICYVVSLRGGGGLLFDMAGLL